MWWMGRSIRGLIGIDPWQGKTIEGELMIRTVIHIDEDKCTGCGLCANACHEGAIGIVGGKAAEGISRQPDMESKIRTTLMLDLVFIETAIIYALLVVILIIFVL